LERLSSQRHDYVNGCVGRIQDHKRQKRDLHVAYQAAGKKLDRLEIELEKATPDEAVIQVREAELADAQDEVKNCEGIYEDLAAHELELGKQSKANKLEMDAAQKVVADLRFQLDKAHSTVRTLKDTRDEGLKKKNAAIEAVAAAEEVKKTWQDEVEDSRNTLAEIMDKAKEIWEERCFVPPDLTSQALTDLMHGMAKLIKDTERELGGSQLDLTRAATEAKQKHHDAMKEFEDIRSLRNVSLRRCIMAIISNAVQQLITTLDNRRNRWKQFRSGISVRARVTFNYLLSERKFRGTLSIDHKKGLLDIHVRMNTTLTLHMALTLSGSTGYYGAKWRWQTDKDAIGR
jgi:chromosome segregation ATPase